MSIGPWQIVLIIAIVLIFFGPSRLPGLGKSIGEAIRGFKKGLDGSVSGEIDVTDSAKKEEIKSESGSRTSAAADSESTRESQNPPKS